MKRLVLALLAGCVFLGAAQAVIITGTDTRNQSQVAQVGYLQLSVTNAITAFAGGGQTSAVLLTSAYNRVTVVATAADSVKLPPCVNGAVGNGLSNSIGLAVWVTNNTAATNLAVFPNTGDLINQGAADASFTVAGAKTAVFICGVAGSWNALLSG